MARSLRSCLVPRGEPVSSLQALLPRSAQSGERASLSNRPVKRGSWKGEGLLPLELLLCLSFPRLFWFPSLGLSQL